MYPPISVSNSNDRRHRLDRRRRPTTFCSTLTRRGRRSGFRRAGEARKQYVDSVSRPVAFLVLGVLVMNAVDGACTLVHLENGAAELNPLMALLLLQGVFVFLVVKGLMTIFGVLILAAHRNFRFSLPCLRLIACGYAVMMLYHGILFVG